MLTQRGDESLLINIEAAKKHIALTRLHSMSASKPIKSRPLLVPVSFAISEVQEKALACLAPVLEEYAMQLELAGPRSCMVRSIPALLENADMAMLVDDILNLNVTDMSGADTKNRMIKVMIAHVCDIPNPAMSKEDMTNLLRQLENSGLDTSLARCAPIWASLNTENLDRLLNGDG